MQENTDNESNTPLKPKKNLINSVEPLNVTPRQLLREGDICPRCGKGRMAYDGLLILRCPDCDFTGDLGAYTC